MGAALPKQTEPRLSMDPVASNPTTRACPFCAEAVNAAAKVCPRCRQWLSIRSFRNPAVNLPLVFIALTTLWLALGLALYKAVSRLWNPPPYYTDSLGSLQVLESRMNWVQTKEGPYIYVTGVLTNISPIAWKDVEFECRFYDAASNMVDAANARSHITIHANDDSAFRATVVPGVSSNEYRSFRISVSTARNWKSVF